MSAPDWKDLLPRPPRGGKLVELWLTSFEPPDPELLVLHLLPALLNIPLGLKGDDTAPEPSLIQLVGALELLRTRLTIVASSSALSRAHRPYPWITRYVDEFSVGSQTRAVQHAKLWAFHWRVGEDEFLQLHVSSANLTLSAFKNQLQACWQAVLPIRQEASQARRASWGELVPFLSALGASAGEMAVPRMARLLALLARASCPPGAGFVASIPGQRGAARQLAAYAPTGLRVLVPTVGNWNVASLAAWCQDAGLSARNIRLLWIAEHHPWSTYAGWAMSPSSCACLEAGGVRIEQLPESAKLSGRQAAGDSRWSHAKLYLLQSRGKQRLLLTSANWSVSAWGTARIAARNFELGVMFGTDWSTLKALGKPFEPPHSRPFCVAACEDEVPEPSTLQWAHAHWDGARIELQARSSNPALPVFARVWMDGAAPQRIALDGGSAAWPWDNARHPPTLARFTQGDDALEVPVHDTRPAWAFAQTPLPETDPAQAQETLEKLLMQRYGGVPMEPDWTADREEDGATPTATLAAAGALADGETPATASADYSVWAWTESRRAFGMVDHWRQMYARAVDDPPLRDILCKDGELLKAMFTRWGHPGALLAAEELQWRLEPSHAG